MPLIRIDDPIDAYRQVETLEKDYSASDIIGAAVETESDIYGAYRSVSDSPPQVSPEEHVAYATGAFNPLTAIQGTRHDTDERRIEFAQMQSPSQVEWLNSRMDGEDQANRIREESPWYQTFLPDLAASLISPTTVIGGGVFKGSATALKFGASAMAATGAQEVALQSQQFTRPTEKSLAIVGGAGLLGGTIGAFAGKQTSKAAPVEMGAAVSHNTGTTGAARASEDISLNDLNKIMADESLSPAEKNLAVANKKGEGSTLRAEKAVKVSTFGFLHKMQPEVRLMLNSNPVMRRFGNKLLNHPFAANKGEVPLEAYARTGISDLEYNIPKIFKEGYVKHSKEFTGTKMSRPEFDHAVRIAMTKANRSAIPEVADTAAKTAVYTNKYSTRAVRAEMLDANVVPLGDESWFPRIYSRGYALSVTPDQFADGLMDGLIKRLELKAAKGDADAAKQLTKTDELRDRLKNMHDAIGYGSSKAGSEYAGLGVLKNPDGTLKISKSRTLDIATEDIPQAYLNDDVVGSLTGRLATMERQLSAAEDPRFGDPTFGNWRQQRIDYHNDQIAAGADGQSLTKQLKYDLNEIDKLAKRYNNVFDGREGTMNNIALAVKNWNILTKLGRVIFSTLPEIAAPLMAVGGKAYVRHIVSTVANPKLMRELTKAQKSDWALGIEVARSSRIAEKGAYDTKLPRSLEVLNKVTDRTLDKIYGLGWWTRFATKQAGIMIQSSFGRSFMRKGGLNAKDKADLNTLGIGEGLWTNIQKEIEQHGERLTGGSYNLNPSKWSDQGLARDVIAALTSSADNIIIRPGIGSAPFMTDTLVGGMSMQFRTFTLSSTSKYWMKGVQQTAMGDTRGLQGMASMSALGALNYVLRSYSYGKVPEMDKETLFREGIVRGGYFGAAGEFHAFLETISSGKLSAFRLAGMEPRVPSNYQATKTLQGTVFGPSFSTMTDVFNATSGLIDGITSGEVSKGDLKSAKRLIPTNNFVATANLWNKGEEQLYRKIGK